ncbi:MAG: hypothetical protein HY691_05290 [Chloroflexi bacterium]|nr:hypothetical protein [Chloroflexota bacterium]
MAQVAPDVRERVGFLLHYLTEAWRELPQAAQDMVGWDLIQQIDYIEEWSSKESLLGELRHLLASAATSADQRAQYDELLRLVDKHRSVLERLRAS